MPRTAEQKERARAKNREWRERNRERLRVQARDYYQANKDKIRRQAKNWHETNRDRAKDSLLRRLYGVDRAWLHEKTAEQQGRCGICGALPRGSSPAVGQLHIDHDHQSGKVRDLLCYRCNLMLGQIESFPELVQPMLDYMEKHR